MSLAVELDADYGALRHWILAVDEREKLNELAVAQPEAQLLRAEGPRG